MSVPAPVTVDESRTGTAAQWVAGIALALGSALVVAFHFGAVGDYAVDAKPSVDALADGRVAHAFSELVALPIAALAYRRRGSLAVRDSALAVLALVFLLRCTLDPVDNAYHHLPLLLALLAWEAVSTTRTSRS
jgi:hypothetical protein